MMYLTKMNFSRDLATTMMYAIDCSVLDSIADKLESSVSEELGFIFFEDGPNYTSLIFTAME